MDPLITVLFYIVLYEKATMIASEISLRKASQDLYSVLRCQQSRCGSGRNKDGSAPTGMIFPPQDEHLQTSLL